MECINRNSRSSQPKDCHKETTRKMNPIHQK